MRKIKDVFPGSATPSETMIFSSRRRSENMTYTSMLVHVQDNKESDERIKLAGLVASRFNAKLIGIGCVPAIDTAARERVKPVFLGHDAAHSRPVLPWYGDEDLEPRFRSAAVSNRGDLEWKTSMQFPADALYHESARADLLIVGQRGRSPVNQPHLALDPAEVVLRCGRPVLIVPPSLSQLAADHVLVAWSNTREARRAVIDALPFLKEASRVSIVEIVEEGGRDNAARRVDAVAEFLRLHDVETHAEVLETIDGTVCETLLVHAEQQHADLIVSGGYGHARAREWMFGGVTRDLLHYSSKCCLLSH
ncbi:universal stress protein [Labrys sp. La1]|uniref:universal stress protein n=1 Tax=Labrys sp. La1 TaxID=3404917 RepID=UPI003EB7E0C7